MTYGTIIISHIGLALLSKLKVEYYRKVDAGLKENEE